MLANFVGTQVVDVGLSILDELQSPLVKLAKIIRSVAELVPIEAQPVDVRLDGLDVLRLFLLGIRVVKTQVGLAAELVGKAKIKKNSLGVANVQVAVGLGRKRVCTIASPIFCARTSSAMMSRRKLEGV